MKTVAIVVTYLVIFNQVVAERFVYKVQSLAESGGWWTENRCFSHSAFQVEGAGIQGANGIYTCFRHDKPCSNVSGDALPTDQFRSQCRASPQRHYDSCEPLSPATGSSSSWRLAPTYLMGKRGRRRVWALSEDASELGTAYFAIPAATVSLPPQASEVDVERHQSIQETSEKVDDYDSEDPGEPHLGAWRVSAHLKTHSAVGAGVDARDHALATHQPPKVTMLPPMSKKEWAEPTNNVTTPATTLPQWHVHIVRAKMLLRCGAWRNALATLDHVLGGNIYHPPNDTRNTTRNPAPQSDSQRSTTTRHLDCAQRHGEGFEALLSLRGLIHVRWAWDLRAGRKDLSAAFQLRQQQQQQQQQQCRCRRDQQHKDQQPEEKEEKKTPFRELEADAVLALVVAADGALAQAAEMMVSHSWVFDHFLESSPDDPESLTPTGAVPIKTALQAALRILTAPPAALIPDPHHDNAEADNEGGGTSRSGGIGSGSDKHDGRMDDQGTNYHQKKKKRWSRRNVIDCAGMGMAPVLEAVSRHLMAAVDSLSRERSAFEENAVGTPTGSAKNKGVTSVRMHDGGCVDSGYLDFQGELQFGNVSSFESSLETPLLDFFLIGEPSLDSLGSSSERVVVKNLPFISQLLDAHLSLTSLYSSAGSQREALRHLSRAMEQLLLLDAPPAVEMQGSAKDHSSSSVKQDTQFVVRKKGASDVKVLKALLLALAPPVLSSSAHHQAHHGIRKVTNKNSGLGPEELDAEADEISMINHNSEALVLTTTLQAVLVKLVDPSNGWGGVLGGDDDADEEDDAGNSNDGGDDDDDDDTVQKGRAGHEGDGVEKNDFEANLRTTAGVGSQGFNDLLGVRWHFLLAYLGVNQAPTMKLVVRALRHLAGPRLATFVAPHLKPLQTSRQSEQPLHASTSGCAPSLLLPPASIRVGFLSAHFHFHSVGRLLANVAATLADDGSSAKTQHSSPSSSTSADSNDAPRSPAFEVFVIHTKPPPLSSSSPSSSSSKDSDSVVAALNRAEREGRLTQVYLPSVFLQDIGNSPKHQRGRRRGGRPKRGVAAWQAFIASLQLDVLVFSDVGMDSTTSALAVLGRYAPVQAVFWGHPVTVGDSLGSSIDYFISSPLFEEKKIQSNRPRSGSEQELEIEMEGDDQKQQQQWLRASHTEQVVLLDGINTWFEKPAFSFLNGGAAASSPDEPRAEATAGRALFVAAARRALFATQPRLLAASGSERLNDDHYKPGNEGHRLYVCAQNPTKLHPAFDVALARILIKDPNALVVLLHNPKQPLTHHLLKTRLLQSLSEEEERDFSATSPSNRKHTLSTDSRFRSLASRVIFVDQTSDFDAYLALQCAADVTLDPFPFGGGVTILEALSCSDNKNYEQKSSSAFNTILVGDMKDNDNSVRVRLPPRIVTAPRLQTVPNLAAGMLRRAHEEDFHSIAKPGIDMPAAESSDLGYRQSNRQSIVERTHHGSHCVSGVESSKDSVQKRSEEEEFEKKTFRTQAKRNSADGGGRRGGGGGVERLWHGTIVESMETYVNEAARLAAASSFMRAENSSLPSSDSSVSSQTATSLRGRASSLWQSEDAVHPWRTFFRNAAHLEQKRACVTAP